MTKEEFMNEINSQFQGWKINSSTLREVEYYANVVAREYWPEIYIVSVELDGDHNMKINLTFRSDQDYVWWNLKNG